MANLDAGHWRTTIRSLGIDEDQMSDMALDSNIRFALKEFNRYLPKQVRATLTLVADQQDYDLPSACMHVWRVYYEPDSTIDTTDVVLEVGDYVYFYLPSQAIIWDQMYSQYASRSLGAWEVLQATTSSKILRLYPTPSRADTMYYIYTATRALNEVPDELETIMIDCILSYVYRSMASLPATQLERFEDSGLTLTVGDRARKYINLSNMHKSSFVEGAKGTEIGFPATRSDQTWAQ